MSVQIQEAVEMQTENEQSASPAAPAASEEIPPVALQDREEEEEEEVSEEAADQSEDYSSELAIPGWSVISFEGVAMSGLSYEEASRWLEKLNEQKISGLCIVTDEAAGRMSR